MDMIQKSHSCNDKRIIITPTYSKRSIFNALTMNGTMNIDDEKKNIQNLLANDVLKANKAYNDAPKTKRPI